MAAAPASAMVSSPSTSPSTAATALPSSLPPIDTGTPVVARDYGASPASSKGKGIPLSRTKSISFHAPSHPSWVGRRKMTRTRTMDSMDDSYSDTDSISTTSGDDDGRYRPRFLPGHLLSRLRRQQQEQQQQVDEDKESSASPTSSFPASALHTYRRTPILSGCLAPFSIMLEVPGLTTKWYVRNGPDGIPVEYRRNPPILEVGLAISIFSAVVANLCLILRFTSIVRPRRGTALAIAGFVLHDAINIAALVAFGVIHAVDDGYSYSQAYWMTLAATAASLACTFTLLLDYLGTRDFKNAGSGLTTKQTQLVIVVMILLVYLSLGSLLYSLLLTIPFEAALYFTCTTTLAVGFGDIVPTTVAAKICLFFYAPLGIALFAVTIVIARGTILEEFENSYRRRREEFRTRLKERRKGLREIRRERKRVRREAQLTRRRTADGGQSGSTPSRKSSILPWRRATLTEAKSKEAEEEQDDAALPRSESPGTYEEPIELDTLGSTSGDGQEAATPTTPSPKDVALNTTASNDDDDLLNTALAAHQRELETGWTQFRSDLALREKTEFWTKLLVAFFLFIAFWLIGAMVFMFTEDWSYFTAFYFCYVLFTTIGFGDYTPKSDAGRSFFIVWSLAGVGVLTILISVVSDAWSSTVTDNLAKTRRKLQEKGRRWRDRVVNRRRRGSGREDPAGRDEGAATDGEDDDGRGHDESAALSDGDLSTDDGGAESRDSARAATTTGGGILQQKSSAPAPQPNAADEIHGTAEHASQDDKDNGDDEAASAHRLAESALRLHAAARDHLHTHRAELLASLRTIPGFREALPRHLFPGMHEEQDEQSPRSPPHHHHFLFWGARRDDDEAEQEMKRPHAQDDVDPAPPPSTPNTSLDLSPLRHLVTTLESSLHRPREAQSVPHGHREEEEDDAATHTAFNHATRLLAFLELQQATRDVLRDVTGWKGKMKGLRVQNERLREQAGKNGATKAREEKESSQRPATTIPGAVVEPKEDG